MVRTGVDWQQLRLEYISDRGSTYKSLSQKYNVKERTVRWHADKEHWQEERVLHRHKVADQLSVATANSAVLTLRQINDAQLRRNEQIRVLLTHKLFMRTPEGKVVPRDSVNVTVIARAVAAFSELYHIDRIILGAEVDSGSQVAHCDRFSSMTDDELEAELDRVRKMKPLVQ